MLAVSVAVTVIAAVALPQWTPEPTTSKVPVSDKLAEILREAGPIVIAGVLSEKLPVMLRSPAEVALNITFTDGMRP